MHDNKISSAVVISYLLWGAVVAAVASGWVFWIAGFWHAAVMLSLLGCATSAAAATAQIRHYSIRVCALIRRLHGMEPRPTSNGAHETLRRVP